VEQRGDAAKPKGAAWRQKWWRYGGIKSGAAAARKIYQLAKYQQTVDARQTVAARLPCGARQEKEKHQCRRSSHGARHRIARQRSVMAAANNGARRACSSGGGGADIAAAAAHIFAARFARNISRLRALFAKSARGIINLVAA
jgi:hypothetical protein